MCYSFAHIASFIGANMGFAYDLLKMGWPNGYNIFIGDVDMSYCLYAGAGRDEIRIEEPKDIAVGGQVIFNLPLLDEFRLGASAYTGIKRTELQYMNITVDSAKVQKLTAQALAEVQDGLIGINEIQSRIQQLIASELQKPDNYTFTNTDVSKSRENVLGADIRLYKHRFGFQSELNFQMTRNLLGGSNGTNYLGVYGLAYVDVIKKMNFVLSPYVCFEHVALRDEENDKLEKSNIADYNITMLGINTKIFGNFGVKLEFSYLDVVTANQYADYQDNSDGPILSGQFNISF